ncbi:TIGR02301 family protein [Prosthecodimorpha staleyi]|uniref:TIGR02301 family protein n=1 Tax=Prosthecodimorpha staleyi TaxID=2840188 RepID=A0A947D103_9HYPH|nr:TIGR02301 family protein [Prosthecodimorpha staleyi]MBT9288631.1 TIGR02301 family protein [Prosthecodimorpha staleyi]
MLAAGLAVSSLAAVPARALPGDPPYAESLMRLAEILGGLHHLRPLCGAPDGQIWRQKMSALIQAQDPTPEDRKRLVERFNQSYRSLAEIHRTCTPAAIEIIDRYLAEGGRLTRDIVSRYGRP